MWQILDNSRDAEKLSAEVVAACRVVSAGLSTFYWTEQSRHNILHHLLTTGEKDLGLKVDAWLPSLCKKISLFEEMFW